MNIKDTRADTIMEYLCRIMLIGTLIYLIVCWAVRSLIRYRHTINAAGEIDDWGGQRDDMVYCDHNVGLVSWHQFLLSAILIYGIPV